MKLASVPAVDELPPDLVEGLARCLAAALVKAYRSRQLRGELLSQVASRSLPPEQADEV